VGSVSVRAVRQALSCLYLPAELANCELSRLVPEAANTENLIERAQVLRRKLLDAINMLRPASRAAPSASASRAYDCIRLRYVSGLSPEEVARQLALSRRQVYRDLNWAEEQLAQLLQSEHQGAPLATPADERSDMLTEEIEMLAHKPEDVHLAGIIESAIATVSPLAHKQGVSIELKEAKEDVIACVTPAILRETVTLLLSAIVQSGVGSTILVEIGCERKVATISMPVREVQALARYDLIRTALQVLDAQHLQYDLVACEADARLVLKVPLAKRCRVLVVEDNPGTHALYERYLSATEWDPVIVPHPRLTVDLAATQQADAIILDIMMSDTDGWTVLQALKKTPRTSEIPVVVCSVVDDPELGRALGATAYLTKPVSRLNLLKTLREALRGRRQASS